jgi:hypothetical protein
VGLFSRLYMDRQPVSMPTCRKAGIGNSDSGLTACHRGAHYNPHSHRGLTTHLILKGQLTITYLKDKNPERTTFGVGDRIDVDAGKLHEVWIGDEGCTYIIGE